MKRFFKKLFDIVLVVVMTCFYLAAVTDCGTAGKETAGLPAAEIFADINSEINPEAGSEENPEAGTEENAEAGTEVNPEAGSEGNPEAGLEENTEAGTEVNPEAGTEGNPEAGTEENPEVSTEENAEAGTEENPEAGTEENPEAGTEENAEVSTEENPEAGTEENPEAGSEENAEAGTEGNPEAGLEENPEAGTEENAEAGTEEKSEVSPEANSEENSETASESNQELEETSKPSPQEEIYSRLIQTQSMEEFDAVFSTLTEKGIADFNQYLQQNTVRAEELTQHIKEIDRGLHIPPTVAFTQAGPFFPPVTVISGNQAVRERGGEPDNGIELNKSAVKNQDGTYTITLESYITGEVKTETKTIPVDLVLLIDQSGSMDYAFAGTTRQQAMKKAVNSFIDGVSRKYSAAADHRMALVEFRSGASTIQGWTELDNAGADTLKNTINKLTADGITNVGAGMQEAERLMGSGYGYTGANTKRQKVVILFTDGVPASSGDFNTEIANAAIASAKNLKNSGVTLYSVGIFEGANPNQTYGGKNPNDSWSASWSIIGGGDIGAVDIPAGNRFLNYVSGNYPNAAGIGLERISRDYIFYKKVTYNVTQTYSGSNAGYYLTAESSADLDNIFQTISDQIATPAVDLGSQAVVKDLISPYFTVPKAENVQVYTADFNGKSFENEVKSQLTATVNGDAISVSGFDYTENFVSEVAKEDGTFGKKLIVKFTVKPKEGFWGGNAVPTNGGSSGLYPDSQSSTALENFEVPAVDVELNIPVLKGADKNIYLSGNAPTPEELCSMEKFNSANQWQRDFVSISCTADKAVSNTRDGQYTVTMVAEPISAGSEKAVSQSVTSKVNVYTPKLIFKDSEMFLGESADYTRNGSNKISWFHGAEELSDKTIMTGTEPALSISYSPAAGKFSADTDVSVTARIGKYDVTQFVTVKNSTTGKIQGITDDHAFTVGVKGCTLTVSKGGNVEENEGFIFKVIGPEGLERTVAVKGSGSVSLSNLPVGTYTVIEDSNWSWKYSSDGIKGTTISPQQPNASVTVINTGKGAAPVGGEACVINSTADTAEN